MFILITHLFLISLDMLDYINYLNYLTLVCVYLQDGYIKSLNKYTGVGGGRGVALYFHHRVPLSSPKSAVSDNYNPNKNDAMKCKFSSYM